jgi:hypothetical protein
MLYCSTHCLCRAGAAVQKLSHNPSRCSWSYLTPVQRGTKHLEHVLKKLLDFFDKDMFQLFETELLLPDHVSPRDGQAQEKFERGTGFYSGPV